jgi:hypothetical protein
LTATRKRGARNPGNLSIFLCKIHSYSGMTRYKGKKRRYQSSALPPNLHRQWVPQNHWSFLGARSHSHWPTAPVQRGIFSLGMPASTNQFILPASGCIIRTYCGVRPNVHGRPPRHASFPIDPPCHPSCHAHIYLFPYRPPPSRRVPIHHTADPW